MEKFKKIVDFEKQNRHRLKPTDKILIQMNFNVLFETCKMLLQWKSCKSPLNKLEMKQKVKKLLEEKFECMEKTAGFLGNFSVPYVLQRIRNSLIEQIESILLPYGLNLKKEEEIFISKKFLFDELDIFLEKRK
jgi:hypothetical protein